MSLREASPCPAQLSEGSARHVSAKIRAKRHDLERRPSTPTRLHFRTNSPWRSGLKSRIRHSGREGGDIRIAFRDFNQLDEFCRRLCQSAH